MKMKLDKKYIDLFPDRLRVSTRKDDWKELSISEKKQILAGIKDADQGKVMDSKTFWESLSNADLPIEHRLLLDERLRRVEDGKASFKNWDLINSKYEGKAL